MVEKYPSLTRDTLEAAVRLFCTKKHAPPGYLIEGVQIENFQSILFADRKAAIRVLNPGKWLLRHSSLPSTDSEFSFAVSVAQGHHFDRKIVHYGPFQHVHGVGNWLNSKFMGPTLNSIVATIGLKWTELQFPDDAEFVPPTLRVSGGTLSLLCFQCAQFHVVEIKEKICMEELKKMFWTMRCPPEHAEALE